jgi:hypothetical protein
MVLPPGRRSQSIRLKNRPLDAPLITLDDGVYIGEQAVEIWNILAVQTASWDV